jgi:hypothetical protein
MKSPLNFKVGDSVTVKPNVQDPDFGIDIEGWQGRISEIHPETQDTTNKRYVASQSGSIRCKRSGLISESSK